LLLSVSEGLLYSGFRQFKRPFRQGNGRLSECLVVAALIGGRVGVVSTEFNQ